jgi:hypothetical protein
VDFHLKNVLTSVKSTGRFCLNRRSFNLLSELTLFFWGGGGSPDSKLGGIVIHTHDVFSTVLQSLVAYGLCAFADFMVGVNILVFHL